MRQSKDIDSLRPSSEMSIADLLAHLEEYSAYITYTALRSEVRADEYVRVPSNVLQYGIEPRASIDPITEAQNATRTCGARRTALLIPGKRFDIHGTRHGQGGGWYDRFLADVPVEWLRIGFCYEDQFSDASCDPLPRQPWDQPVDIVCVVNRELSLVTLHKTSAREHDIPTIDA